MSESKICKDVAIEEFNRFADMMQIDRDVNAMTEEDQKSFKIQYDRIVLAICEGCLVVDNEGQPVFTPMRSNTKTAIIFYEPTGKVIQAMDRRAATHQISKMYDVLAAMTKQSVSRFEEMKLRDLHVCEAIAALFLTV